MAFCHTLSDSQITSVYPTLRCPSLTQPFDKPQAHCGLRSLCVSHKTSPSVNREKTNKMQQLDVYYQILSQHVSGIIMPIFRRTKTACYCIWCTALVLLDVVGSGCGALRCRVWALWRESNSNLHSARLLQRSAPHPLPTTSSRTSAAHHVQ